MKITNLLTQYCSDMTFKNYSNTTIDMYSNIVLKFMTDFSLKFFNPSRINSELIKSWIKDNSKSTSDLKIKIGALKTFYKYTVKQPLKFKYIEYPRTEKRSPIILSHKEIKKLFEVCTNVKHKMIMYIAYGTGARVSEILNMKMADIDRTNFVIHVMNGKGNKQRQLTLKPKLLSKLDEYLKMYNPKEYLFNGQNNSLQYTASSINQFLKKYAKLADIKKRIHIHLIRHNFATHSLDAGENLYIIQKILGHSSPKTTANNYLHMSSKIVANAYSPIEAL